MTRASVFCIQCFISGLDSASTGSVDTEPDPDRETESGSGSGKAKMIPEKEKKLYILCLYTVSVQHSLGLKISSRASSEFGLLTSYLKH